MIIYLFTTALFTNRIQSRSERLRITAVQRLDAVEGRTGVRTRLLVEGLIDLPSHIEEALYRVTE